MDARDPRLLLTLKAVMTNAAGTTPSDDLNAAHSLAPAQAHARHKHEIRRSVTTIGFALCLNLNHVLPHPSPKDWPTTRHRRGRPMASGES
jgi:hypothetical protein